MDHRVGACPLCHHNVRFENLGRAIKQVTRNPVHLEIILDEVETGICPVCHSMHFWNIRTIHPDENFYKTEYTIPDRPIAWYAIPAEPKPIKIAFEQGV